MAGSVVPHGERGPERLWFDRAAWWVERLLPLLILTVAAFLRFFRLDSLPPGLLFDEAYNGVDILSILSGERPIFLTGNFGREALFIYLQALSVSVLGRTDLALRAVSAIVGLLTIIASYYLIGRLFGRRVALLSSGWLALSVWHVIFSRIGLRSISLPLFEVLAFYCLWRGLASHRKLIWFALSGLALGASLYTYTSARFVPIVVVALAVYLAIVHRSRLRLALPGLILVAVVALIVFLPEGLFFISNPEAFTSRADAVSIFNPKENMGSPLAALQLASQRTLGMFSLEGDHNWDRNISGRPVFDPLSAVLAVLGLVMVIRRWRDPAHAFLLLWLCIMVIPSVLAVRDVPNYLRVTGLIPGLFVLPALGLTSLWSHWEARVRPRLQSIPIFLIAIAFVAASVLTYRDYFQIWARSPKVAAVFNADRWATIQAATRLGPSFGRLYVAAGEPTDPIPTYVFQGQPGVETIWFFDTVRSFILPPTGVEAAYLIPDNRLPAAQQLERFFPGQRGEVVGGAVTGPRIFLYRLPATRTEFAPQLPLAARFGDILELAGCDLTRDVQAGQDMTITWYWKLLAAHTRELFFSNLLMDANGNRIGQKDDLAFAPDYWPGGTEGIASFTFSVDANAPTGPYWPQIGVYDRATFQMLAISDPQGKPVGEGLRLPPVKVHGTPQPAPEVGTTLQARFGDQVDLLGYDLDTRQAKPGGQVTLTLYWGPRGRPSRDYTVFVQLLDANGKIQGQGDSPPKQGKYPTSLWDAGEIIADAHVLTLSPEAAPGEYHLAIGLYAPENGHRVPVVDGTGATIGDNIVVSGLSAK